MLRFFKGIWKRNISHGNLIADFKLHGARKNHFKYTIKLSQVEESVTNNLEIDKGFSRLLYLKFFCKQPTGIVYESI